MADIFISYSKASLALTKSLAEELEAKGYVVWWDTGLLPGESFSDVIISELDKARAAIVIWTPDSIKSQWVRSEARRASLRGTLIPVRDEGLDPNDIPPPFDNLHTDLITNRAAILAALSRLGVVPPAPRSPEPPPKLDTDVVEMVAIEHWQAIKATTDPGRLREFLAEFGGSKVARLARDRIVSLEETAWRELPRRRTAEVLSAFLKDFPDGRYAETAAAAIAELKAAQVPKAVRKPAPPPPQDTSRPKATASAHSRRWLQVLLGMGCMGVIADIQLNRSLYVSPITQAQGWSYAEVQFAFSIFIVAQVWLIPLPGYLVDRFGPKWVVCGGAALVGLAGILDASAGSLAVLYLAAALGGVGTGAVYAAAIGCTLKWFEDRRGLAVGLVAAGFALIGPFSTPVVASTIDLWGYRGAFLVWGLGHGVALALMGLCMRAPRLNEVFASASGQPADRASRPADALQTPSFWVLYCIFALIALASPIMTSRFFTIARELNIPLSSLGALFSMSSIALTLSQPFFGWMSDRFGRENTMGAAFALSAVAVAALWLLPANETRLSLVYCVTFVATGAATVLIPAACADRFGRTFAATNYGLLHTARGLGGLLVGVAGAAFVSAGMESALLALVAGLSLIAAVAAMFVLKPLAGRPSSGVVGR